MTKQEQLNELYLDAKNTLAAHVLFGRCVFGVGNVDSPAVFIGEAPGRFESEQGVPFVGKAGQTLDELFSLAKLNREDFYITNAVKFRPVSIGKKGFCNRTPNMSEIKLCRSILLKELEIIAPKMVVTLGNTPLKALLGNQAQSLGDCHGQKICGQYKFDIIPLYHPASVIYNRALKQTLEEDMKLVANVRLNG